MINQRFSNRSVLVTGGGSGIGRATALAFSREGALVTVVDIDEKRGSAVVSEILANRGVAQLIVSDATDESQVVTMLARVSSSHGPLRHAFNNVGHMQPGSLETMTRDTWDQTLAGSLTSTFLAMKHEIPIMRNRGGGTIVNTASIAGRIYDGASPAYAAAKAGVIHLSHHASCSYGGQNIRINSVSPGLVATPAIDRILSAERKEQYIANRQVIARPIVAEEVAATVLFLSSDEAAMITGVDVEVTGGRP